MIEKNSVAAEHAVRFAIISAQVKARHFADAVRTARMKRRRFALRTFPRLAEHFAGTREVETAIRLQLLERGQHVMGAVDVDVQGRETIGKTLGNETLRSQVITLIELLTDEYVKDARVAFQSCSVEHQPILKIEDSLKSLLRRFERDSSHQAVDFIS